MGCRGESKRYLGGTSILSTRERYEKLFSFYKTNLFFSRKTYTFVHDEKILQIQAIFVVDEDIDWDSIAVIRYVFEKHGQKSPQPLLYSTAIKGKPSIFWNLIDAKYGERDVVEAIESGRSFFVEKDFLVGNLECSSSVKRSHLPIIPIHSFRSNEKHFYRFGSAIRATDLIKISNLAFSTMMENVFIKLREKFLNDIRRNEKERERKKNKFLLF